MFVGEKVIFYIWAAALVLFLLPFSFYLAVVVELAMIRQAKIASKNRREFLLYAFVPPFAWRTAKAIRNERHDRLGYSLGFYSVVWFWSAFIVLGAGPDKFNIADWIELFLVIVLTTWLIVGGFRRYRSGWLKAMTICRKIQQQTLNSQEKNIVYR